MQRAGEHRFLSVCCPLEDSKPCEIMGSGENGNSCYCSLSRDQCRSMLGSVGLPNRVEDVRVLPRTPRKPLHHKRLAGNEKAQGQLPTPPEDSEVEAFLESSTASTTKRQIDEACGLPGDVDDQRRELSQQEAQLRNSDPAIERKRLETLAVPGWTPSDQRLPSGFWCDAARSAGSAHCTVGSRVLHRTRGRSEPPRVRGSLTARLAWMS